MGSNIFKINDNVYELTDEIHEALSSTGNSGKSMRKDSNFLFLNNITNDGGFKRIGDRTKNCKTFLPTVLPKNVAEVESRNEDKKESDSLEGYGMKVFIPSNRLDIYTILEVLLGLKVSSLTDTLIEASSL